MRSGGATGRQAKAQEGTGMAEKDITERLLASRNDVFADIVNEETQ